jgi:hypothetical protein
MITMVARKNPNYTKTILSIFNKKYCGWRSWIPLNITSIAQPKSYSATRALHIALPYGEYSLYIDKPP